MGSSMREDEDANDVDEQTHDTDAQEFFVMNVNRFHESLDRFRKDEKRDEDQKNSVDESGKSIRADVAVSVPVVRAPSSDDGGDETEEESRAIEEHVERVRNETERVCPKTVKQFNEGE